MIRASLYACLAELLAEPPEWMGLPGQEWPLYEALSALAHASPTARYYLSLVAALPATRIEQLSERYHALFYSGQPHYWLYESITTTGRVLGKTTHEMAHLYQSAGLKIIGAELPDHISLELAFLSYLARQESGVSEQSNSLIHESQFLDKHGQWMIDLGHALEESGDEVYAIIGGLLADWLSEAVSYFSHRSYARSHEGHRERINLPAIPYPEDCTLCGFCAQVCPTRALKVLEDDKEALLILNTNVCIHCNKCVRICEFKALKSVPYKEEPKDKDFSTCLEKEDGFPYRILHRSPIVRCQNCGQPIASQAELTYIETRIGEAIWQSLCLDCRAKLYA